MDLRIRGPREHEKADRDQKAEEECGDEEALRGAETVLADLRLDDVVKIGVVECHVNYHCHGDAEEGEPHLAKIETVHLDVDEWEGLRNRLVKGVAVDDGVQHTSKKE